MKGQAGDTDTSVERIRPVTLADGSNAMRADIAYPDNRGNAVRRVQVMNRGGLTFILVLSTPASELTDQWRTFETMLVSFTSFPPAPYGIPRDRALTMPLGSPATLDPAIVRDTTTHLFVSSLFSGLVRMAPTSPSTPISPSDGKLTRASSTPSRFARA